MLVLVPLEFPVIYLYYVHYSVGDDVTQFRIHTIQNLGDDLFGE
jgi:hypothetical protein